MIGCNFPTVYYKFFAVTISISKCGINSDFFLIKLVIFNVFYVYDLQALKKTYLYWTLQRTLHILYGGLVACVYVITRTETIYEQSS